MASKEELQIRGQVAITAVLIVMLAIQLAGMLNPQWTAIFAQVAGEKV